MNKTLRYFSILAVVLLLMVFSAGDGLVSTLAGAPAVAGPLPGVIWLGHPELVAANPPCPEKAVSAKPAIGDQGVATGTVSDEPAGLSQDVREKTTGRHCRTTLKSWPGHPDIPAWTCF